MANERKQSNSDKIDGLVNLCVCANLRRASRAVTSLYDEFLRPSGLLATQYTLLSALAKQSSIAVSPLAELLGMDPTTLARNLKPLEREGLVQIVKGEDRRKRLVKLTAKGLDVQIKAVPLWEQAQAAIVNKIGQERWRTMLADWSDLRAIAQK